MENKELEKLQIEDTQYITNLSPRYKSRKPYSPALPGEVISFIPGTIVEILVETGSQVKSGDDLMILEAMKMKNRVKSQISGVVKKIDVNPGDRVTKGTLLMEIG